MNQEQSIGDQLYAFGSDMWSAGYMLGDTIWSGVEDTATATGDFIAGQYDAATDTAYEVVTTPSRAVDTVAEGYRDALSTGADALEDVAGAGAKVIEDLSEAAGDAMRYAPFVVGIGLLGFAGYRMGWFK